MALLSHSELNHETWGRIYASMKQGILGTGTGLSIVWCQLNHCHLKPLGRNHKYFVSEMHLNMLSANWQPFYWSVNVLPITHPSKSSVIALHRFPLTCNEWGWHFACNGNISYFIHTCRALYSITCIHQRNRNQWVAILATVLTWYWHSVMWFLRRHINSGVTVSVADGQGPVSI